MSEIQNRRFSDQYWNFLKNSPLLLEEIKKGAFNREKNKGISTQKDIAKQLQENSWERHFEKGFPHFTFLGLRITTNCNLAKRCKYCDQEEVRNKLGMQDWKNIIDEATEKGKRKGINISISGGEPLLFGDFLYGDNGLIKYASKRGGIVNVNTNFHLLTPQVATSLIKSGLNALHVSLDAPNEAIHDELENVGTFRRVWESIYLMRKAKHVTNSEHPTLFINTVATKRNIGHFDKLLESLLVRGKFSEDDFENSLYELAPQLVLLGGEENVKLRPNEKDWNSFMKETWPNACEVWEKFQDKYKIPKEKRISLSERSFFANPFTRVRHDQNINDVIKNFTKGDYGATSLCDECYASPTQAYVLANGDVYQCGSLADTNSKPIGNILETSSIREIVKQGFDSQYKSLGRNNPHCMGCYGSTLKINQDIEKILKSNHHK